MSDETRHDAGEHGLDEWHEHTPDEGLPQPEHGAQANPTALAITFLAMVFGVLFVVIVLAIYFNTYTTRLSAARTEHTRGAAEYLSLRSAAETRLSSAGIIDREAGTVHIPLEDAMRDVVERYRSVRERADASGTDGR